jgi:hypothetical protein
MCVVGKLQGKRCACRHLTRRCDETIIGQKVPTINRAYVGTETARPPRVEIVRRVCAIVELLASLGVRDAAYQLIRARWYKAMEENDINDIFSNVLLLITLADPRAEEIMDPLRERFRNEANALAAVEGYAVQLKTRVGQ